MQEVFDCDGAKDVESIAILSREGAEKSVRDSKVGMGRHLATHLRQHIKSREPREPAGRHSELLQPEPSLGEEAEMSIAYDRSPF